MDNFVFQSKTKIYFGKEQENNVGSIIKSLGFSRVLLVYGSNSIKKIGLYEKVVNSLKTNGIYFCEVGFVRANPTRSMAMAGIYLAKKNNCDFILAVGGGSVIDCAKSIACGFYYDGDCFDFNAHVAEPTNALPVGCILTISAAGSELSNSCVMSNDSTNQKNGFNSELIRPVFAIENPQLTCSVSKYQTACGITDIISHSFERYFQSSTSEMLSDNMALAVIKTVVRNSFAVLDNPDDYEARGEIMLASSFSHNDLTNLGKKKMLTVHQVEHVISGIRPDIAHGAGLAVLMPIWLRSVYTFMISKVAKFGREVFNINIDNDDDCAIISMQKFENFLKEIGMPSSLADLNLTKDDCAIIADIVTKNGTRELGHTVKSINREELLDALLKYGY